MEAETRKVLRDLSVTTLQSVRLPVAAMSGGQRQSVAVAKAVLWNSKLVVLDEPTAALGVAQTRQVLDLTRRLATQGLGVILISHNMSDVFEVADDITVLRLGQTVAEFKRTETTQREVVEAITAGQLHEVPGMQEVVGMSASTSTPAAPRPGRPSRRDRQRVSLGVVCAPTRRGAARGRARIAPDRDRNHRDRDLLPGAQLELPDRGQLREPDRADGGDHDHRHRASCSCCSSARSTCRSATSAAWAA